MKRLSEPPHPLHILMIEDVPMDFELITHQLRQGGLAFSSKRIETQEELSNELEEQPPSIVLCDHGSAQLDSFSVLETVRTHSPVMPFIVVTGSLEEKQIAQAFTRGADDCVLKHQLADLVPAVQRALRLGEMRQRLAEAEAERDQLRTEIAAWRLGSPQAKTIVPICAGCKKVRRPLGDWQQLETYFHEHFKIHFSHGLCPHCVKVYSTNLK